MNHSYKLSLLFSSLFLVILLAGCGSNTDINNTQFDLNKNSVLNAPYSISSSRSFAFNKAAVEKQLGKPDTSRSMKSYSYEMRKVSDGSEIFTIYNENRYVSDTWRLTQLLNPELFKDIKSGKSSVNDVKKIDPYF